jgi:hypothetical protein
LIIKARLKGENMNIVLIKKETKEKRAGTISPEKEFVKLITSIKNKKSVNFKITKENEIGICWNLLKEAIKSSLTKDGFIKFCTKNYSKRNSIKSTCLEGRWLSFCYVCELGKYNYKNPKTPKFPNHIEIITIGEI